MYVCVCLRVCVCVYVYVCVCLRAYVCVCAHTCISLSLCARVLTIGVYGRVSMLPSVFLHAFMCVRVCIKIEAYIHKIPTLPDFSGLLLFRSRLLT